jgi:hypothetical protein
MVRRRQRFIGERTSVAFLPSFEGEYDQTTTLLRRDGGRPLTWIERLLIKFSIRFARSRRAESEILTPDEVIEQLANIVAGCIDRGAIASFGATYGELIRYHRFLFDAQDTVDSEGQPFNFAEVAYFAAFEPPYRTWIRQYRHLFERAAVKLDVEPTFIKRLAYSPRNLLPEDARDRSSLIVTSVLEIGVQLPVMLGNWFARHTTVDSSEGLPAQERLSLTGSDERAYRPVVYEFISAWESLIQMAPYTYHWAEARRNDVSQWWKAVSQSWDFYRIHLSHTAYITGLAVWNQDQLGTDRYRDMLVRWRSTARTDIREDYFVPHNWLLLPSDFLVDWEDLKERLLEIRANPSIRDIEADALFNSFLRHLHNDVLTITTAVFLIWRASSPQIQGIADEAAVSVHRRLHIEDGAFRSPQPQDATAHPFRIAMACVVRGEIGPRDGYGGFLDGLVRSLNGIVEAIKVPGRMYGGFGWDSRQSLDLQMLAILIASLPEKGDSGFCNDLDDACGRPRLFTNGDGALRSIIQEFTRLLGELRDETMRDAIGVSVELLKPGASLQDGVDHLDKIMTDTISVIEKRRTERLLHVPLDTRKLTALRDQMTQALTSLPNILPWSEGARFLEEPGVKPGVKATFYHPLDKGNLTDPLMAHPSLNEFEFWVEVFLNTLIVRTMNEFLARPREKIIVESEDAFWSLVQQRRGDIGPRPALFVPAAIANQVMMWSEGFEEKPDFVSTISRDPEQLTGHGVGYMATVNGMEILSFGMPADMALLFSMEILKSVSASSIDTAGHLVDVEFEHDGDPHNGRLSATMAVELHWDDSPMFEIHIEG